MGVGWWRSEGGLLGERNEERGGRKDDRWEGGGWAECCCVGGGALSFCVGAGSKERERLVKDVDMEGRVESSRRRVGSGG